MHRGTPYMDMPIRPCHVYQDELKECKSIRGRFHQLFIFGETLDCSQWENDYQNCQIWGKEHSEAAYKSLVNSQQKRIDERFQAHFRNNIWERRATPPENWNQPLPDYLNERVNSSSLVAYYDELQQQKTGPSKKESCTIL
ncbi:synaptic plasticity regulator PANTS isoform X2 [Prorops nasuta]|uniref:synaptic plasticity regulator PANTS isoform X2 n=1 Tax=Prorops nasuta TaxID=863751 RepID=UPI0034CE4738